MFIIKSSIVAILMSMIGYVFLRYTEQIQHWTISDYDIDAKNDCKLESTYLKKYYRSRTYYIVIKIAGWFASIVGVLSWIAVFVGIFG